MPWDLEGTGIYGESCPESEAAPAFRGLPQPAPMEMSLLSKHVVMGVWQECTDLLFGALQLSHAKASPAECVAESDDSQWCPLFYNPRFPALVSRDPSIFSLVCLTDMSSSCIAETHRFSHQCHRLGCGPLLYIATKLFRTEGNSGVMAGLEPSGCT